MITCPKCSKENQDHYKFCLGCGAELPRDAAPKAFSPQTPPHGMRAAQPAGASAQQAAAPIGQPTASVAPRPAPMPAAAPTAAAPAPAAGGSLTCPQCGHVNAPSNKHEPRFRFGRCVCASGSRRRSRGGALTRRWRGASRAHGAARRRYRSRYLSLARSGDDRRA